MGAHTATTRSSEKRRLKADIDQGWAWVILFASFMSLFLTCGALYSVSIFNVIFLEHFQESKAITSLVGSILIGLIALMGPVSSILANRFGWRVPMMLGGLIATIGTFMASMAQSIVHILISYGVIAGIGLGLAYTPAIVVVGYYFEKYRTMASGLASVGAGVGMMAFPPVIRLLSDYFSWREMLTYVSCLYAQLCVFGALMRPLPMEQFQNSSVTVTKNPSESTEEKMNINEEKDQDVTDINDKKQHLSTYGLNNNKYSVKTNVTEMATLCCKEITSTPEMHSLLGNCTGDATTNNMKHSASFDTSDKSPRVIQIDVDKYRKAQINGTSKPMLCSNGLNSAHSLVHLEDIHRHNIKISQVSCNRNLNGLHSSKEISSSALSLPYGMRSSTEFLKSRKNFNLVKTGKQKECYCNNIGLYFGTCCQYSCSCNHQKTNDDNNKNVISSCDKSPTLLSGQFVIFCASIFMFGIGLSALYLHLSAFAITSGASETEASFLITLLGISSIISRVFTGIAGNDTSIDNTILYIGAFGIAGISTMLCPTYGASSKGRMFYALSFGFYGSCFNVLLAPLTVEIIGLKKLSTAFGIEMVVNGVAYFLGPPIAGLLYDLTGTYNTSFFLAGVCLISSAVVMMMVSVFKRKELPLSINDSKIAKSLTSG